MATRSGSVDPGALLYVLREHGLMRRRARPRAPARVRAAALGGLDEPLRRSTSTRTGSPGVAAMAVALGGLDVLAFSGGVARTGPTSATAITAQLASSAPFASGRPRREELVIAREVAACSPGLTRTLPAVSPRGSGRARDGAGARASDSVR